VQIRSFIVATCMSLTSAAFAQSALKVDWAWKRSNQCSPISPALTVADIPAEAKRLDVKMVDLGFTQFNHGGGSVAHAGELTVAIPIGALKDYRGPCPMRNLYFGSEYEFTVRAIAADGNTVLAQGSATRTYSTSVVKD
jgi:phosphatidylethanolamine-binding protein (PEBP) family uncharacterized protein